MQSYRGQKGVKRLHVNQHNMRANVKDAENRPIFTCKVGKENHYGHSVEIHGPSVLVYPEKPLGCGARAWVETVSPITVTKELEDGTIMRSEVP